MLAGEAGWRAVGTVVYCSVVGRRRNTHGRRRGDVWEGPRRRKKLYHIVGVGQRVDGCVMCGRGSSDLGYPGDDDCHATRRSLLVQEIGKPVTYIRYIHPDNT